MSALKAANKEIKGMMMLVKIQDIYNLKDEMMDMTDISNEIQESLGRSYSVPDDIDEDDLLGDVALITCLRDEMNLVSEEFMGCQALKKGVFIISEEQHSLLAPEGAPLVNPLGMRQKVDGSLLLRCGRQAVIKTRGVMVHPVEDFYGSSNRDHVEGGLVGVGTTMFAALRDLQSPQFLPFGSAKRPRSVQKTLIEWYGYVGYWLPEEGGR
ncbi:vacuolar protein sorting-associated protein 60.2-like protein [Tanacetum coccineum]